MQEPPVNGWLVVAGPVSPEKAICPSCDGVVKKHKRRRKDGQATYFYQHRRNGEGMSETKLSLAQKRLGGRGTGDVEVEQGFRPWSLQMRVGDRRCLAP